MRGKSRAATGAVRHYLVALIQQPFVRHLLYRPPHGLDISVVVSNVRVLHVRPVTYAVGHDLPLVLILPHRLLALFDEGLDAVLLYLLLAVDAEHLLHFQLNGQPVSVPTGFPADIVPLHGLVTRDYILHDTGEDVADMRLAVGGGRTVVKIEALASLILFNALFKDLVFLPERQNFLFAFHKVERSVYGFVHHLPLYYKIIKIIP